MRKIFLCFSFCVGLSFMSRAQSVHEARKMIYYELLTSAKTALNQQIANGMATPETWYLLAEIYLKERKVDSAALLLKNIPGKLLENPELQKDNSLVFIAWAHTLLDSGLVSNARTIFETTLDAGKYKDREALLAVAKANVASKNGDIKWAIELLDKVQKKDKKNPEVFVTLGDAYRRIVDGGNAIVNYDKALKLNSAFAEAMFKKGMIYKTQQNPDIYLKRFENAYEIDSTYAPTLYELYYYYYFRDVNKADVFLRAYIRHTDKDPNHDYMLADLQFVSRKYKEAIASSQDILGSLGAKAQPRLYKLIAYSQAALGDSAAALKSIESYFSNQDTAELVSKDFVLRADLLKKFQPVDIQISDLYSKGVALEKDSVARLNLLVLIADMYQKEGDRASEANFRQKIVESKNPPANLDIYNWGMALFSSEEYMKSDSVFALYADRYPDEVYGYLWRARSNALIDTTMENGLAIPHYLKLIEVSLKDSIKNKALLLKSYQYLGAYEANITKDFEASRRFYEKILAINPAEADAERNVNLLTKWIEDEQGSK